MAKTLKYRDKAPLIYTHASILEKCGVVAQGTNLYSADTLGAFHLVKNSENSGWELNEKRFFGSPNWKIPRKSGTAQKVVPFSRLERPYWFLLFQLHLPGNLYQFQAHGNRIFQTGYLASHQICPLETDLMTSDLDINQTNADTWHWTGIDGLPKRFPCGIIPVAATSLHKISNVPLVIRK